VGKVDMEISFPHASTKKYIVLIQENQEFYRTILFFFLFVWIMTILTTYPLNEKRHTNRCKFILLKCLLKMVYFGYILDYIYMDWSFSKTLT